MNSSRLSGLSLTLALAIAGMATAQTIYVDTAADVTDFAGAQRVSDLPGPDGKISLAEAGLASDNTPGVQTIGFHVPQNEWTFQWLYPGRVVLQPFLGFRVFQTAILDATTQTAFTGETNPNGGGEVVIMAATYLIDNVGGVVRGFDSSQLTVSGGSSNFVRGNTNVSVDVYDSPFTIVGGTNPGEGNTASTIKIDRSSNNVVIGNTTMRVRVLGGGPLEPPTIHTRVGGPTLAERNFITGYGTWNSEGYPGGVTVQIAYATDTLIENNWIGTTPDGLAQGHLAATVGVGVEDSCFATTIRNNRIAGILGHGQGPHAAGQLFGNAIQMYGNGDGVTIQGNKIGLNANDQATLGSVTGIMTVNYYLGPFQNVVIGGSATGEGNEIAGHLISGIGIANTFSGVRISGNSIHDNGGLGIELVNSGFQIGVTQNDTLDPDVGGNGLQNFPVLQSAAIAGSTVRVIGTLNSNANASYTLEFFGSPQCDSTGYGEGRSFLGSTSVSTNGSGNASFDVTLNAALATGSFVTATATAANGSTSEFSACVGATGSNFAWTNLGHALAGTNGNPLLTGTGSLAINSTVTWSLSNAKGSAPAWILVGFSQLNLPFGGGLIVPNPDIVFPTATSATGTFDLNVSVPSVVPSGLAISAQVWLLDSGGIVGFAASNAITATAP